MNRKNCAGAGELRLRIGVETSVELVGSGYGFTIAFAKCHRRR